jgi:hypothetical protein
LHKTWCHARYPWDGDFAHHMSPYGMSHFTIPWVLKEPVSFWNPICANQDHHQMHHLWSWTLIQCNNPLAYHLHHCTGFKHHLKGCSSFNDQLVYFILIMLDIVPWMFKSYHIKSFKARVELLWVVWVEAMDLECKILNFFKLEIAI